LVGRSSFVQKISNAMTPKTEIKIWVSLGLDFCKQTAVTLSLSLTFSFQTQQHNEATGNNNQQYTDQCGRKVNPIDTLDNDSHNTILAKLPLQIIFL
jgi:hypothetical protein